jgi:Starter unit:ACP transacylase in aflatoxin biosynthesis
VPSFELAKQPKMTNHAHVYVFGDQTSSFEGALSEFLQQTENSFLSSFFERTGFALRQEVARLPTEERAAFPSFNTIGDLLAKYIGHQKNPALDMAFACIHQFALYIRFVGHACCSSYQAHERIARKASLAQTTQNLLIISQSAFVLVYSQVQPSAHVIHWPICFQHQSKLCY